MSLVVNGKRADRIIQGTAQLSSLTQAQANALLDDVAAAGATTFDLAENYGGGKSEALFGGWLAGRGNRDDLFIITKGAHPYGGRNRVTSHDIGADIAGSLERLGCGFVDLYLLHRDDESVPIDEVVDVLHGLKARGLVNAYGLSNWRTQRIAAANEYAKARGYDPVSASSPHFSLAVPTESPWPGCVSLSGSDGAAERAFYAATGMPVLAWSSLAMGYFVVPAPGATTAAGLNEAVRVFDTPANAARRARAEELGARLGLSAPQVALLYVLSQPFDTHAIVGCRSGDEYRELRVLAERRLTAAEVGWLEGA